MPKGFAYKKGAKPKRPGLSPYSLPTFQGVPISMVNMDGSHEKAMREGANAINDMDSLYRKFAKPPSSYWVPTKAYKAYEYFLWHSSDRMVATSAHITGDRLMFRGVPVYFSDEVDSISAMYSSGV